MLSEGLAGVSVIICTCNGGKNLKETLTYLSRQQVRPDLRWEIILIDNASTDNTAQIAIQTWSDLMSPVSFEVLNEPRPGKNNAVDTGLQQARYQYVLICDDDNWLGEHYVQTAFEVISADPETGMLGGRGGFPFFGGEKPVWFDQFENYYAVGRQNQVSGEVVTSKGFLWGAGAVINREAYFQLRAAGFSRIITYEKYPQIARGEDIELCMAIRLAGYKICYNEELHFQHFISKPKLTWKYLTRLAKEGAAMGLILSQYRRHLNNPSPAAIRTGSWVKLLLRHVYSGISYKRWRWLLSAPGQEGNAEVLKALFEWHSLKAIMSFNKELDRISAGIGQLAANLRSTQSVGQRESSGYRS